MSFRFFLIFVFTTIWYTTNADNYIEFSNENSANYIGRYIEVFEDPSKEVTIHQILNDTHPFKGDFPDVPNLGMSNSTFWFKFKLVNNTNEDKLVVNIENPLLKYATLYIVHTGRLDSISIDSISENKHKAYAHQFFTFKVNIEKGDSVTCYLKTESNTQLIVPISINYRSDVINQLLAFDLRTGIFVGLMLAMLLYNLFLYISARDKQYLYYVNYIWWVAVAQAAVSGFFHKYFGNEFILLDYIVPFAGAMSGIASVLFVKSFLSVKSYNKRFDSYLNIIIIADLFALLLLFVDLTLAYKLVNTTAGIGSVVVLYIGFYVRKKGNKVANLFLLAWGIFLSSVIIFVLKDLGVIKYSQFTTYIVQLGASIEAMLLSFALGNKINTYRKEKEESQLREFNALRENERLIKEQNEILAIKIEERTYELQQANYSLETTLHELKAAQSQLVESEKMASLGQLTAGVAHEINNPINFVTSNVKPLKRDLEMVWEAFDFIEKVALQDGLDNTQKEVEINKYKEELDIEYLKSEMDFLLKGMHDGASRTAEIVKSLRIFSRVDEDVVMRADVNLGIESTLVIIGSLIGGNIRLEKNLGAIPQIECYPGKLNQVFLNILTNAIYAIDKKYVNKPGGLLHIDSSYNENENMLIIVIGDNGIGIPQEIINKIFDPFFTTKDVGEGTGLGMSIVYNTIAKHNGEITVDSVEGEGTTFIIKLPVSQPV